jgi:putative redox protein
MKIIARMLEDEIYEAHNEAGHNITMDMREASLKQNQSPPELLLSSLAGCGAVDIVIMLKKRKKTIQDFVIETVGVRRDEQPRKFLEIHCKYIVTSPDVEPEEFEKFARLSLEKYCTVAATLNSKITFTTEIKRS